MGLDLDKAAPTGDGAPALAWDKPESLADCEKLVADRGNLVKKLLEIRGRHKFGPDPLRAVELDRLYGIFHGTNNGQETKAVTMESVSEKMLSAMAACEADVGERVPFDCIERLSVLDNIPYKV